MKSRHTYFSRSLFACSFVFSDIVLVDIDLLQYRTDLEAEHFFNLMLSISWMQQDAETSASAASFAQQSSSAAAKFAATIVITNEYTAPQPRYGRRLLGVQRRRRIPYLDRFSESES